MRLRAFVFLLIALGGAGYGAQRLAVRATAELEARTTARAADALDAAGLGWADATADGLRLRLQGAGPDEASRLRALEIVRRIAGPARIDDQTTLADAPEAPAPPYGLELLRDGAAITAVGLVPDGARDAIAAAAADGQLDDLVETLAAPAPPGWDAAFAFGLAALADLPQARVTVAPGQVAVTALAADDAERRAIEAALQARRPADIRLALAIDAPLPPIAPFVFDLALTPGGPRLAACSAGSAADAAALLAAAGLPGGDCAIGTGAPSPDWTAAAAAGAAALRALGAGRFTLTDAAARLEPDAAADPARAAEAHAALAAALPAGFALAAAAPAPAAPAAAAPAPAEAPRFAATLAADGAVRLDGVVGDAASRDAIGAVAAAAFGAGAVDNALAVAPGLPAGWPGRALAALDALALLKEGEASVTPDAARITGSAEAITGAGAARALLTAGAPGRVEVSVRFDAVAAAEEARQRALLEDPEGLCAAAVARTMADHPIAFQPGSAEFAADGDAAVAALTQTLALCPPVDFEIAGHTDAAGDPARNQALSEERAERVKAALETADLPQIRLVARGYGATRPIADNATPEGRAANRRIEMTLIVEPPDQPDEAEPGALSGTGQDQSPTYVEPFIGPR